MRKLFTVLATAVVLLAGSALMKAEAAPMRGLGDMSPVAKGYSPVETSAAGAAPIAAPAVAIMVPAITAITATAGPIAGATKRASDPNAVGSDRQPSRSLHNHARETSSPKIPNTPDRHGGIRVLQTKGELIRSSARRVRSQLLDVERAQVFLMRLSAKIPNGLV